MSLRVKAALVIISIIFLFTAASFFSNFSFTKRKMTEAMEQDLTLALTIADDLISTNIRLLKTDADSVAERLLHIPPGEEMERAMALQLEIYPDLIGLTVYGRESVVANQGEPSNCGFTLKESRYLSTAFEGTAVLSTAHYSALTGEFLIHVFVPMGEEMVLSATVPGMFFSDIVSNYRLWQTGSIFIIDEEGTFIANYRPYLVQERHNFIFESLDNPEAKNRGDFTQKMITTDYGSGTYFYEGLERLCIYQRITGSNAGWRVGVTAPFNETPEANVQRGLLLSSLIFLIAGIFISFFVSGIAVRPFYRIEEQNKSLAELNETVLAASEAKTRFLANMSHEMRTPLNAIIGLSDLTLEAGALNADARENLEKINSAGATLLNTVNDILDISKIEAGKLELVPVEYNTPSMINDAVTQSILHKGENPVEFILNIDENIPARLYGDELRIKQIFNNLLSNAFKYTREGTVELKIRSETADAGLPGGKTVRLIVSVRDTGIGIRSEDINSLFSDYTRMDLKSNRKIEGTGLGLSITKRVAEMTGGSLSVESEYGKGSVFTVEIPQKFVTDTVIGPDIVQNLKNFSYSANKRGLNLRISRISLPYARVLLVDDVAANLDVAKGMMKPYGMQIDCVSSGREAVNAVRTEKVRYNAIFMDHMMPEMDGIEATRIIRSEIGTEYAKTVPIIALTANAIVGNENMFLSKGFQAFISKPIEITRLDAVIKQWVRDKELEKTLGYGETFVDIRTEPDRHDRRMSAEKIEGLDLQKALERFGGDEDSCLQVLRSYAVNTRPLIETLKALDENNLAAYAVTVHGIKGSSRGICAETLGAKAEALEKAAKEGDFAYVAARNAAFIEAASKLVTDIDGMLNRIADLNPKPKKDKPDRESLLKLLESCENYYMDGADAAMAEIEAYEYDSDDGLAAWLRENIERMNFAQIAEKLSAVREGP